MFAATDPELPLPPTPMNFKPGLLSNAFPQLVDQAGETRTFLAPWLAAVMVKEITAENTVKCVLTSDKLDEFRGLTQPNTHRYLNTLLQEHLHDPNAGFEFSYEATPNPIPEAAPSTKPQTPRASKAPVNKLTLHEVFKLGDWIRQNAERVKVEPDTRLAAIAQAELGFPVSVSNFSSTREAAGIEKVKPAAPPTLEERVTALEQIVAKLTADAHPNAKAPTTETEAA